MVAVEGEGVTDEGVVTMAGGGLMMMCEGLEVMTGFESAEVVTGGLEDEGVMIAGLESVQTTGGVTTLGERSVVVTWVELVAVDLDDRRAERRVETARMEVGRKTAA